MSVGAADLRFRYLDKNGDGTGAKNANEDYSDVGLGATEFYFEAVYPTKIRSVIVSGEDAGGMTAQEYGNLGAALTNGYSLKAKNAADDVLCDFNDGVPITTNSNTGRMCFDSDVKPWGAGNDLLLVRFTIAKCGRPLILEPGEKLVVTFNDDLSGLISHYLQAQGHIINCAEDRE